MSLVARFRERVTSTRGALIRIGALDAEIARVDAFEAIIQLL